MNDGAMMAAQRFPPGMSRLERLPDELKLKIGCFLTAPSAAEPAGNLPAAIEIGDDDFIDVLLMLWAPPEEDTHNDSVLALACTSTRLCNIFLVEHSKKYGLQNTLYRSIQLGDINLVQRAVEYGADINKTGPVPWKATALQLAVKSEQLPIILYLLQRGVGKADELLMEVLRNRIIYTEKRFQNISARGGPFPMNHCRCNLLHALIDAALGGSQASRGGSRLPRETQDALAPAGCHLWLILRTYMKGDWACDCSEASDHDCPMRLVRLLQRYGAKWMPCRPFEHMPQGEIPVFNFSDDDWEDDWDWTYNRRCSRGRGLADLRRFRQPLSRPSQHVKVEDPTFIRPSVASAMHAKLLANEAYRQDHCIPFLVAMLEHGVTAEEGDLSHAMDLAIMPDTRQLSVAIVVALLQGGTDPNERGAMKTAMRLACMSATRDAGLAFARLLLEHGADPGECELRDEIHCAAEKWWVQSAWQSSGVFRRILGLLVDGGLDKNLAGEILAVLGLDRDALAKDTGASVEV